MGFSGEIVELTVLWVKLLLMATRNPASTGEVGSPYDEFQPHPRLLILDVLSINTSGVDKRGVKMG